MSFAYCMDQGALKRTFYLIGLSISVIVLMSFKKYLLNFNSSKAVRLMDWNIFSTLLIIMFSVFNAVYKDQIHSDNLAHVHLVRNSIYAVSFYFVGFFDIYIHIILGIELIRIEDDFIGLLKQMGKMLAYVYPGPMVLLILINFYAPLYDILHSPHYMWLIVFLAVFSNISNGLLVIAFYRAQRYLNRKAEECLHEVEL